MSDPLYPQQLAVHFEEDGVDLVAGTPGPAGVAELELADDITILVDFADPGSLSSIRVDGDRLPDVMVELIGEERADQLAVAEWRSDAKPFRLTSDRPTRDLRDREFRGSRPTAPNEAAQEIGALAQLRSIAEGEDVHDVIRATSALEYVERARRVDDQIPGLIDHARQAAELAAQLLDGEDENLIELSIREPKAGIQLAGLCRPFQSDFEPLRRAYELLTDSLAYSDGQLGVTSRVANIDSLVSSRAIGEDFDFEAPIRLSAVTLTEGGLLTARVTKYEDGSWLRITREGTQVLLAVVPVRERDGRAVAEAILPTDVNLNQLDLQLTSSPLPERVTGLDRVLEAVDLGRAAVLRSLAGRSPVSDALWLQCADAWDRAGDESRAKRARRYAARGLSSTGPLLVTADVIGVFASAS